jgi:hypothetical protein
MNPNLILPYFKKNQHRILLLFTCLFVAALGVFAFIVPPGIDPDPCWGFLVMHGMEQGHPFNMLVSPDPHNIAKNHYEFLAWWSPGQYLLPYIFKILLGVNTGRAVALTITICSLSGIAGFYKLFTRLGFSKWLSAISVAFIASQLFFFKGFTYFTGGEFLLFAFLGWFLYGCFSIKKISWQALIYVFVGGLAGFIAKSSVLWMYAAAVGCIWVNVSLNQTIFSHKTSFVKWYHQQNLWSWFKNGLLLAIPFISALAVIYICYLSKGDNPTSDQGPVLIRPETYGFPLASPIVAGFSVDELFHGLIYQTDVPTISYQWAVTLLFVFSACCIAYLFFIGRLSPDRKYVIVLISFYVLGSLFFSYMYLKQATISYEGRHFRMIGLLFMPGFIYLIFKTKLTRVLFFILWGAYTCIGVATFYIDYNGNKVSPKGPSGLSQQVYDKVTIDELLRLDNLHRNDAIFVVTGPDLAMEIKQNRVITIDDETLAIIYATQKFAGKAGTIYIFTANSYNKNGKLQAIIKSFVNYHHFTFKHIGKDYCLATATD